MTSPFRTMRQSTYSYRALPGFSGRRSIVLIQPATGARRFQFDTKFSLNPNSTLPDALHVVQVTHEPPTLSPSSISMRSALPPQNGHGLLKEVGSERARYNDDGWAVEQASQRLAKQEAVEKFLIVLSDGVPEPSSTHSGKQFDLKKVVDKIIKESKQKVVGLGIGPNTEHVRKYYPNNLANINTKDMAQKLADLIKEAIANYEKF